MPRITEYALPQRGAVDQTVTSGVNVQAAGIRGRQLQQFGQSVTRLEGVIHKRNVQKETATAHKKTSELRSKYTVLINNAIADGSINSEQVLEDYQRDFDANIEEFSTPEGKDFYNRQGVSIRAQVTQNSALGEAQVEGKGFLQDVEDSRRENGVALQNAPDSFLDIIRQSNEFIDESVSKGIKLTPAQLTQVKAELNNDYAMNAIRGHAKSNPDVAEGMLNAGFFDKYFRSGDSKKRAFAEVSAARSAQKTEDKRREVTDRERQRAFDDAWQGENLPKLVDHSLSIDDILTSGMSPARKIQWRSMLDASLKTEAKSSPRIYNDFARRILLPDDDPNKIDDITDMFGAVGRGLTPTDLNKLVKLMTSTPEGAALKQNRKLIYDLADAQLLGRNPISGFVDPQGPFRVSAFTQDLQRAEDALRAQGKPIDSLYDVKSSDYFGLQIPKYKRSQMEIINDVSNSMTEEAAKKSVVIDLEADNPSMRKRGETIEQFKKRTGGE